MHVTCSHSNSQNSNRSTHKLFVAWIIKDGTESEYILSRIRCVELSTENSLSGPSSELWLCREHRAY